MVNHHKKMWSWVFGIGLFINILALGFFGFNEFQHRPIPGGPELKEVIANELQFDEQQRTIFAGLVKIHQIQSAEIRKEINEAKKAYYQFENPKPETLQQLIATYGKLDSLNYLHFRDIRGLCKDKQIKAFDHLVEKILTSSNFGFMGPRPGR